MPAPDREKVDGVSEGKVEQFVIDSNETKLFNPGIARNEFGMVDPNNPKTLIVETHNIDYKRRITVYASVRIDSRSSTLASEGFETASKPKGGDDLPISPLVIPPSGKTKNERGSRRRVTI